MRDSRGEGTRWLRQADSDLTFAEFAVREGFFSQACFICQQAAERALKAILYAEGEHLVLGYSLVELLARVLPADPTADRAATALRRDAGVLDQYYVTTRYPNGLPGGVPFEAFGEDQARAATVAARNFMELARERLGPAADAG